MQYFFSKKINSKGFTVGELLVTIAISSVIMLTVLFEYGKFNDNLAIASAVQEMAVNIRQAQTYGINVKETAVGAGQFGYAYGVYFSIPTTVDYYLFIDSNGNNKYDVGSGCGSGSTECVEKISLRNSIKISQICDATTCPPSSANGEQIMFLRPNPDAKIYFTNSSGTVVAGPSTQGRITLISPKNKTKTVTVESSGQILVQL